VTTAIESLRRNLAGRNPDGCIDEVPVAMLLDVLAAFDGEREKAKAARALLEAAHGARDAVVVLGAEADAKRLRAALRDLAAGVWRLVQERRATDGKLSIALIGMVNDLEIAALSPAASAPVDPADPFKETT
jgi:hypothetical protein